MKTLTTKQKKKKKLAKQLQDEWIKEKKDWRTPVWGYFRDEAERILNKPKQNEYNKIIDALNEIDEMIEHSNITYAEQKRVAKAYKLVANFIDWYAKR
jgi:hypothetical protein